MSSSQNKLKLGALVATMVLGAVAAGCVAESSNDEATGKVGQAVTTFASGFVWASQPTSDSYIAPAPYSSSSIKITRDGPGLYEFMFPISGGVTGGNVQVTPYGSGNARCAVTAPSPFIYTDQGGQSWAIVWLQCVTPDGFLTDTMYTASYLYRSDTPGIEGGYVYAGHPTTASYTLPSNGAAAWNSTGQAVQVERLDTGYYAVTFPGQSITGGTVEVTVFDGVFGTCESAGWGGSTAYVRCFTNVAGRSVEPMDDAFMLRFTQGSPNGTSSYAYAWANEPSNPATYQPSALYQKSVIGSECGPLVQPAINITRESLGMYTVNFPGLPFSSDPNQIFYKSNVTVTAYGFSGEYCNVGYWYGTTSGSSAVVFCFDVFGNATDARFNVTYSSSDFLVC
jgi:hypothetical protein